MKPKILVTRKISDDAEKKLQQNFDVTLNLKDEPIPTSELIKMANEYDGFVSTGFDKIGEEFFNNLNGKLKIIAQVGVGYDNISVKSAENKKVKVTNTPNVLNEAVAETTILLILAASRRAGEAYSLVKSGKWKDQKPDLTKFMIGNSVTGKTLGIIGMGRIGRMAAKSAKAFGMKIIYFNRNKLIVVAFNICFVSAVAGVCMLTKSHLGIIELISEKYFAPSSKSSDNLFLLK